MQARADESKSFAFESQDDRAGKRGAGEQFDTLIPTVAAQKPSGGCDANRRLGNGQNLDAILPIQQARLAANDYTIRLGNPVYLLLPPAWPGLR